MKIFIYSVSLFKLNCPAKFIVMIKSCFPNKGKIFFLQKNLFVKFLFCGIFYPWRIWDGFKCIFSC